MTAPLGKRFLMISPLFPPSRVIGAKRALHLARHLPALGWVPAVVALPAEIEPEPALVPLVPDVPIWRGYQGGPVAWVESALGKKLDRYPDQRRPKAPSRQPSAVRRFRRAFHIFDRYTAYLPWAFAGALGMIRREECRAIHVSLGPRSGILLADALAKATGLPLVLDLRDPWSIMPSYQQMRSAEGQRGVELVEAWSFGIAAKIVVNTEAALAAYLETYRDRIPAERFSVIRNSFDPELYGPPPPPPGTEPPFRIIFYGHLRPSRSAVPFLTALRRFIDEEQLQPGEIVLTTLGIRTPADEQAIADLGLAGYTEVHPEVPFTECRRVLGRADLLLDLNGPGHTLTISGKFYDYLACGRPILSVSPNPEVGRILDELGVGRRIEDNQDAMVGALRDALHEKRSGRPFAPRQDVLARYHARAAAERFAAVLDEVAA